MILGVALPTPFRIFIDHVTIFKSYAESKMGLFVTNKGNSCELLFTESFVLHVTGLLTLTLKGIDKFKLRE